MHGANLWDLRRQATSVVEVKLTIAGAAKEHRLDGAHHVIIGGDWGILAFDSWDELEAFQRHARAQDDRAAMAIRRLHMHWELGPERQRAMMQRALGTEVTPIASVDQGEVRSPLDEAGAWKLVVVLAGLNAWLRAEQPVFDGPISATPADAHLHVELVRAHVDDPVAGTLELSWPDYELLVSGANPP